MPKTIVLLLVLIIWLSPEIVAVYFIMPLWGGQEWDMYHWSYFCYNYAWFFRITFGAMFFLLARKIWISTQNKLHKPFIILLLLVYGGVTYMANFMMRADNRYVQPMNKVFATKSKNKVPIDRLVLGVEINGDIKAYPIQYLAYHHQIVDTVGNEPLMVTYCNVCRTGRIFSAKVNGKNEAFRLVGMSQWNAMFEDKTTGSWWQQATGEAIIGPLKGSQLNEIECQQVTLREWFAQHPKSLIFQPDSSFVETYADYKAYEDGTTEGTLTRYDTNSWQQKSWIVGIEIGSKSIAYDWNDLKDQKLIQNTFENIAILVLLGEEDKSFRVWNRKVGPVVLDFFRNDSTQMLMDKQTMSVWADYGKCLEGQLAGTQLKSIKAYQEYWHSWQDFHSNTAQYLDDHR